MSLISRTRLPGTAFPQGQLAMPCNKIPERPGSHHREKQIVAPWPRLLYCELSPHESPYLHAAHAELGAWSRIGYGRSARHGGKLAVFSDQNFKIRVILLHEAFPDRLAVRPGQL